MYGRLPSFVFGFHGCDKSVCDGIVRGEINCLNVSTNDYDWLGNGIYFWENDPKRALEFAQFLKDHPERSHQNIRNPAVIGAAIDLGYCFNLMEAASLATLKRSYDHLKKRVEDICGELPENVSTIESSEDLLLRKLDCLVIQTTHALLKEADIREYDSVRGLFFEGARLYPNAGFKEKNHIQICVRNPNSIKAYFLPRSVDDSFDIL